MLSIFFSVVCVCFAFLFLLLLLFPFPASPIPYFFPLLSSISNFSRDLRFFLYCVCFSLFLSLSFIFFYFLFHANLFFCLFLSICFLPVFVFSTSMFLCSVCIPPSLYLFPSLPLFLACLSFLTFYSPGRRRTIFLPQMALFVARFTNLPFS